MLRAAAHAFLAVFLASRAGSVLDAKARQMAIRAIEQAIQSTYVFPNLRPEIVERLERARQAHRFDTDDPGVFAQRITQELQAASHDGHLYLDSDPAEYAARLAPPASGNGLEALRRAEAVRDNSGLLRESVLPGNIRYLKIAAFQWSADITPQAYENAARFLRDADSVIIDLRANGGGVSDAADSCSKGLIDPNRSKPVYILVDGHTASAAEAVAYAAQIERVAVIVGATTYGAANNNKKLPIAPQFVLSVSNYRPINPITGTNWEGVGVKPNLASPPSRALETAELDALEKLSARPGTTADRLAEYRWAKVDVESSLHPVKLSAAQLRSFPGSFGPITIRTSHEGLSLYRADRPRWPKAIPLTPLAEEGLFSVDGFEGLRLRVTEKHMEFLYGSEADREVFPRDRPKR